MKKVDQCTVVDVFAGVGGLTYGFNLEGFNVVAGIDADQACEYPYEHNNPGSTFIPKKIEDVKADDVLALYPAGGAADLRGDNVDRTILRRGMGLIDHRRQAAQQRGCERLETIAGGDHDRVGADHGGLEVVCRYGVALAARQRYRNLVHGAFDGALLY